MATHRTDFLPVVFDAEIIYDDVHERVIGYPLINGQRVESMRVELSSAANIPTAADGVRAELVENVRKVLRDALRERLPKK